MSMKYEFVAPRVADDVTRLYLDARVAGLEVSHYPSLPCRVFDGAPRPGCVLGVFRVVGALVFYKDDRRWEVRARCDANAVDMATLVTLGLQIAAQYGSHPGHWTRKRQFRHIVSQRTNKRIAWANVCYQLNASDLTLGAATREQVPTFSDRDLLTLLS